MSEWSDKTILVYDYGLFVEFAVVLAREGGFKCVYYYTPWKDAYPGVKGTLIGQGLPNLHRVHDLWDVEDEIDGVVFPDVGDGDLQHKFKRDGKLVWGTFYAEELELDRWQTKQWVKRAGLPLVPSERFVGLDALEAYLRENDDKWVKVSIYRGSMETWRHETWAISEKKMATLRTELGEAGLFMEFIVEDNLDEKDYVEIGYDGWNIQGKWPELAMLGYEIKGEALAGVVKPYTEFPKPVLAVNEKLAPVLANYECAGAFSTELRVDRDGKPFLIDPCMRFGSPPGELACELWENWPEIVWAGMHGEVIKPVPTARYGFELMLYSNWVSKDWAPVLVPNETRRWVKLAFSTHLRHDNVVPQMFKSTKIGAVIGLGDTLQEAMDHCLENRESVKGLEIDSDLNAVERAYETIKEGESHGIDFFLPGEAGKEDQ